MYKTIIGVILFFGLLFLITDIIKTYYENKNKITKIVYRYIPRTFEDIQENPISITEIFETLFTQPSPWISSIATYDRHKQENINKYFISQL